MHVLSAVQELDDPFDPARGSNHYEVVPLLETQFRPGCRDGLIAS